MRQKSKDKYNVRKNHKNVLYKRGMISRLIKELNLLTESKMRTYIIAALVATMASAMDDEGFTYEEWEFHNWAAKYKWGRMMDELRADMAGVPDYHWDLIPNLFR